MTAEKTLLRERKKVGRRSNGEGSGKRGSKKQTKKKKKTAKEKKSARGCGLRQNHIFNLDKYGLIGEKTLKRGRKSRGRGRVTHLSDRCPNGRENLKHWGG